MIKFLDISKQDKAIRPKILSDIKKIFKKNDYILGKNVKEKYFRLYNSKKITKNIIELTF